jgi:hypothetical protein
MRDQAKAPAFSETYSEQAEDNVRKTHGFGHDQPDGRKPAFEGQVAGGFLNEPDSPSGKQVFLDLVRFLGHECALEKLRGVEWLLPSIETLEPLTVA